MSIRRLFSFLCLSALSINSWADDYADLHASVARLSPDLQIMAVAETPMTGILKVVINTGETIYMSADGNYFLAGNLYCLLYTSPSPRDRSLSRMPSSA